MQNGSKKVDFRKDVPFAVKNRWLLFIVHDPYKVTICQFFELQKLSLDFAFITRSPEREHPLFFIKAQ